MDGKFPCKEKSTCKSSAESGWGYRRGEALCRAPRQSAEAKGDSGTRQS